MSRMMKESSERKTRGECVMRFLILRVRSMKGVSIAVLVGGEVEVVLKGVVSGGIGIAAGFWFGGEV